MNSHRTQDYPSPLPQAEVRELLRLAQSPIVSLHAAKIRAKQRIILHNMRLVCSIAKRFSPWAGIDIDDLIAEGAIALCRAVDGFNLLRVGSKDDQFIQFSTFASWAIRNEFIRLGRLRARRAAHEKLLDAADMLEDDRILPVFDAAGFEGPPAFPNRYGRHIGVGDVLQALELLEERRRRVLLLRVGKLRPSFPIANGTLTLREVSRELKISKERVRQLEAQGLKELADLCGFDSPVSISGVG